MNYNILSIIAGSVKGLPSLIFIYFHGDLNMNKSTHGRTSQGTHLQHSYNNQIKLHSASFLT